MGDCSFASKHFREYRYRMENELEDAYSEVDRDLSVEWLQLSERVRTLLGQLGTKAQATELAGDISTLTTETTRLCDHLERIHQDVAKLLVELDEKLPEIDLNSPAVHPDEVQREAIQIHRETHELRADFKDIIKALFMWQDDPVERAKYRK